MAEVRHTTQAIDAVTLTLIANTTGNDALYRALGYLSAWNMTMPFLRITGGIYDGIPELVATYRREDNGPIAYQIGAVWHPNDDEPNGGHFGFHS